MANTMPGALVLLLASASAAPAAVDLVDVFHREQTDSANVSYFCFRIPALVRAADGALVAFAEGRHVNCDDAGDVRIVRRISYDEGASWSPIDQVKVEPGHTIGNPCPIVDRVTGDVHLLYSRDNKEVFVTRSTDGGQSWGPSTNLTASLKLELDPTNTFVATGPPGGVQLASGRLVGAFYYNGLNGTRSAALFSDDHGASWRRGAEVRVSQTPLPNASSVVYMGGEAQVAEYQPAGAQGLVMLMRVRGDFPALARHATAAARRQPTLSAAGARAADALARAPAPPNAVDHNHAVAISSDGGQTWSAASLLHATSSYCEGSIATVGEAVLLSVPSTTNGGRANLTVWAAHASGASLDSEYVLSLYGGAAAYSSMLAGKGAGTVLNLFERDNDPWVPKNLTLATFAVPQRALGGGPWLAGAREAGAREAGAQRADAQLTDAQLTDAQLTGAEAGLRATQGPGDESGGRATRAELHVHLDGAIPATTLLRVAQRRELQLPVVGIPTSVDDIYAALHSLGEAWQWFDLVNDVIGGDAPTLTEVAAEFVARQAAEGIAYTEVRYDPVRAARSAYANVTITREAAVAAVAAGLKAGSEAHAVEAHQLLCAMRGEPAAACFELVELAARARSGALGGVVGIDLAGDEFHFNNSQGQVEECFRHATLELRLNATVHAREMGRPLMAPLLAC